MAHATIRQVAARAGVSYQTVSNVINQNGGVGAATREQVLAAISELSYQPNFAARALSLARTQTVACIVYHAYPGRFADPYIGRVMEGISETLQASQYKFLMQAIDGEPTSVETLFLQRRIDGALLIGYDVPDDLLSRLLAWSYPLVVLDRIVPGGVIPCVSADYRGGIGRAVAHLVARGCHQLAFIGGNTPPTTFSNSSASERLEGFREALGAHLIEPGDAPIVISDWTFEGGRKSLRTLLERPEPPDGVVVANDRMAAGVLKEARIQGLNVPDELAVVGFDDFEFARYLEPSLTTVHLPARAMAARATEILLNLIGGVPEAAEISTVLPIELVVRESA